MLDVKKLLAKILDLFVLRTYSITWGGTTVQMKKRCGVVQGVIWNPRTVAAGTNAIGTLPVGWRPSVDCVWICHAPNSTSTNVDLRYTINASNGVFSVYNYGSAWTNIDSNITESFTYII